MRWVQTFCCPWSRWASLRRRRNGHGNDLGQDIPSKYAKYNLLLTFWLARVWVLTAGGGVLRAPHSQRAAASCALAMALAALTMAAA